MIIASAIKFYSKNSEYPIIMTGHRHPNIFNKMAEMGIQYNKDTCVQGFMTDDFHFLNRYEAKKYAIECGQIMETKYDELFSEDLW